MTGRKKRMHTIRLSMESRKTIFRIETLSEEINPEWTLVFHRIFKDKLITYLEEQEKTKRGLFFQGETTFWLQHSAMQASLFVPLASNDEKIRDIIVHLLKLHFEFINANYSSLKTKESPLSHLELYQLAYTLQMAYNFYLRTEEICRFSLLFTSAAARVLNIWEQSIIRSNLNGMMGKNLCIEAATHLEEIFSNITRHTDLRNQASSVVALLEKTKSIPISEEQELFQKGINTISSYKKEEILNELLGKIKQAQVKESTTELYFCQLLLNYFKI